MYSNKSEKVAKNVYNKLTTTTVGKYVCVTTFSVALLEKLRVIDAAKCFFKR